MYTIQESNSNSDATKVKRKLIRSLQLQIVVKEDSLENTHHYYFITCTCSQTQRDHRPDIVVDFDLVSCPALLNNFPHLSVILALILTKQPCCFWVCWRVWVWITQQRLQSNNPDYPIKVCFFSKLLNDHFVLMFHKKKLIKLSFYKKGLCLKYIKSHLLALTHRVILSGLCLKKSHV